MVPPSPASSAMAASTGRGPVPWPGGDPGGPLVIVSGSFGEAAAEAVVVVVVVLFSGGSLRGLCGAPAPDTPPAIVAVVLGTPPTPSTPSSTNTCSSGIVGGDG